MNILISSTQIKQSTLQTKYFNIKPVDMNDNIMFKNLKNFKSNWKNNHKQIYYYHLPGKHTIYAINPYYLRIESIFLLVNIFILTQVTGNNIGLEGLTLKVFS